MTGFEKATSISGVLGWLGIAITWCIVADAWSEHFAAIVFSTLVIAWVIRDAHKRLLRSREVTSTFTFARENRDDAAAPDHLSMSEITEAAEKASRRRSWPSGVPFEITFVDAVDGRHTLVGVIRDRGDMDARDRFIAAFDAELLRVDGPPVERIVTVA